MPTHRLDPTVPVMVVKNFFLRPEQIDQLALESKASGAPVAELVRRYIDAGLAHGSAKGAPAAKAAKVSKVATVRAPAKRVKSAGTDAVARPPKARRSKPTPPLTLHDMSDAFEEAWAMYPKRPNNSKALARRAWGVRLSEGVPAAVMAKGLTRYIDYVQRERLHPRHIKQAATFFGPDRHFLEDYDDVTAPKKVTQSERNEDNLNSWLGDEDGESDRGAALADDAPPVDAEFEVVDDGK